MPLRTQTDYQVGPFDPSTDFVATNIDHRRLTAQKLPSATQSSARFESRPIGNPYGTFMKTPERSASEYD